MPSAANAFHWTSAGRAYTVHPFSELPCHSPPPLSLDELREISARSPAGSDSRRLLWEIRRLHALARRFDQLVDAIGAGARAGGCIYDVAMSELDREPAVIEYRAGRMRREP